MTDQLCRHPDDLEALVARTAAARGLPAPYVEKDFWVTEVLRAASVDRTVGMPDGSTAPVVFLFKGGTSLSRVFGIVDRFSEDVDLLAVFPDGAAANARHKVLKQVDTDVTAQLGLTKSDVTIGASTTGVKRYTTYHYPVAEYDEGLKEGVLLELGSRGGTYPAGPHSYRSMVADYAITELGETEDTWEEFASFTVNVLAPERTLLEKVAAVHDAAVRSDTEILLKHGRHFYDIDRLLNTATVVEALDALGSDGFAELVEDINAHSADAGFSWSPRPDGGYADSPAFDPHSEARETIRAAFDAAQDLIHGTRITLDDVTMTVQTNRERL
ncbi:nucleotidyl transferase AbiEii/AbiGii toxin family protein [Isoptericola croceus]|uniref:nucleotidyl transferase AbiEii/AbiGii toxin family protein n=1 Tax=Isoptericola croceus TaxID=3031406 RepID=UPI0023F7E152|nr:nucleotidyl transferase AbiEii/AbiGii toxin family protein [Isoptericola croceus]